MSFFLPVDGEVECLDFYQPGGYHPVVLDDNINNRYCIAHKLGYGGYSVVWLAWDRELKQYVALKIARARASEHLRREAAALRTFRVEDVPTVLDEFDIEGPNGRHACFTMTMAAGDLAAAKYGYVFPTDVARALSAKVATIVHHLHNNSWCHGGASHRIG